MTWASNLRKGVDIPTWDWLSMFPQGGAFQGSCNAYDGTRYIYWIIQYGSASSASTTQLWRYDTWSDGWLFVASLTSTFSGCDIVYDHVRNCLWIALGNSTTTWFCYNLNLTNITTLNQTIVPFSLTTISTVLPANAGAGASLAVPDDVEAQDPFATGTLTTGNTTTNLFVTQANACWNDGMVGLAVRMTSGTASGQRRIITAISATGNNVTVAPAFGATPASGDAFVVEYPQGTATSGSVSTLVDSGQSWPTNIYSNHDVVIIAGTGSGQRRRIASNTGTTLTLAAATTGNPRTGNWTTAPDATSQYEIVVSSDFLYYTSGGTTATMWRIDLATGLNASTFTALTSAPATLGGGADLIHPHSSAPFSLFTPRGLSTNTMYRYSIGLNTWATWTTLGSGETLGDGSSVVALHSVPNAPIAVLIGGTTRIVTINQTDKVFNAAGTHPFAAGSARSAKLMRQITTPDGVKWLYVMRNSGQEFFRMALEWY